MSVPIILIMADQLRWDCLSAYGSLPVPTPHLDALAEESVVFERAYCASPICTPTRSSMMTGKPPHVHGALVNTHAPDHPDALWGRVGPAHETVYECLARSGYRVGHLGKLHVATHPSVPERVPTGDWEGERTWFAHARSRDLPWNNFCVPAVQAHRVPSIEYHGGRPVASVLDPFIRVRYEPDAEDFYDVWLSHRAEQIIAETDFASGQHYHEFQFWAPHAPLAVPEPYFSRFCPDDITLPDDVGRWYDGQPASLTRIHPGRQGASRTRDEYRGAWAAYFGLVAVVDECVGRVVTALKRRGVWNDALVIFCTDHGEMLGSHWMAGKMCAYEASSRLAWFVKPPGGGNGRRGQLVSAIDYAATVCDYAGIAAPEGQQGVSLRRFIDDPEAAGPETVFIEWHGNQGLDPVYHMKAAVGDLPSGTWKSILHATGEEELYHLDVDPVETRNRAGEAPIETAALRERLLRWGRSMPSHESAPFRFVSPAVTLARDTYRR